MLSYLWPLLQVGVVFAIFAGAMWALKRYGNKTRGAHAEQVAVLATVPLGRSASVSVVRIGEVTLALGVTEGSVTSLGEVTLPDVPEPEGQPAASRQPLISRAPAGDGFWARFTAAAAEQGPVPKTLIGGVAHTVRSVRAMTPAGRATLAATEPGPDAAAFAGALAAAHQAQVAAPQTAEVTR